MIDQEVESENSIDLETIEAEMKNYHNKIFVKNADKYMKYGDIQEFYAGNGGYIVGSCALVVLREILLQLEPANDDDEDDDEDDIKDNVKDNVKDDDEEDDEDEDDDEDDEDEDDYEDDDV